MYINHLYNTNQQRMSLVGELGDRRDESQQSNPSEIYITIQQKSATFSRGLNGRSNCHTIDGIKRQKQAAPSAVRPPRESQLHLPRESQLNWTDPGSNSKEPPTMKRCIRCNASQHSLSPQNSHVFAIYISLKPSSLRKSIIWHFQPIWTLSTMLWSWLKFLWQFNKEYLD